MQNVKVLYKHLPQVSEILERREVQELLRRYPRPLVLAAVREVLATTRDEIGRGTMTVDLLQTRMEGLNERIAQVLRDGGRSALQPVINATGVILQTNLGRAPLSEAAVEQIAAIARGYCNLEFDLDPGERGHRGAHVEKLLLQVLGCESGERAALVVNNCAAATFLALNSLAEGGEVIVSRGELVEIGGGFRVPEILRKSGARLVEVGTTNRTRVEDYAAAITGETRLILRVHRSNFQIVGFTEQPNIQELVQLGAEAGVPVAVDQGTGCVASLKEFGLEQESLFAAGVKSGAALVCASGDKLLGGPQCGLIVGGRGIIEKLRNNPLYRALRVDKLTFAGLQATLLAYVSDQQGTVPALAMIALSADGIRERCESWATLFRSAQVDADVVATESVVGGGTTPGATLPSFAVALRAKGRSADDVAAVLRQLEPPVIARIHDNQVLLDLRTVPSGVDDSAPFSIAQRLNATAAVVEDRAASAR